MQFVYQYLKIVNDLFACYAGSSIFNQILNKKIVKLSDKIHIRIQNITPNDHIALIIEHRRSRYSENKQWKNITTYVALELKTIMSSYVIFSTCFMPLINSKINIS